MNKNPAEVSEAAYAFQRLYEILICLRNPEGGCPWDIEQTPLSMRSDLLEEAFEAVEAISDFDAPHVQEELGDVLLNAVMIAYMHEQSGDFTVADSLWTVCEKLIRRHPHVFDSDSLNCEEHSELETPEAVLKQWDTIKQTLEGRKTESILDEVSVGLPPLMRALKLQKKAAKKGFDWDTIDDVFEKVSEEFNEIKEAIEEADQVHLEEEIGDMFFALVNVSRHLHVDPSVALTRANAKFTSRFKYVESQMQKRNVPMDHSVLEEMDVLWDEAKCLEQ